MGHVAVVTLAVALAVPGVAFAQGGSLDPSFGSDGVVLTQVGSGSGSFLQKLVRQPDGKLVAGGRASLGTHPVLALARYRRNGSLDTGFGANGTVFTDLPGDQPWLSDLVALSNGKLTALAPLPSTDPGDESGFTLVRYLRDGRVDRSFGRRGRVSVDGPRFAGFTVAMVRKHDNRLIVLMAPVGYGTDAHARGAGIVLVQFRADGRLDRTFGHNGVAHLTRSGIGPSAFALRRDGKVVVAGYSARKPPHRGVLLARFLPSGRLDSKFGDGGLRTASLGLGGVSVKSLIAAPTGELIVAGDGAMNVGGAGGFLVADFRSNGALRTGFGDGGAARVDFTSGIDYLEALVRQPDGKLVAAGTANPPGDTTPTRPALVRLLPNGRPDPTFGQPGQEGTLLPPPVTSGDNSFGDLVRQPDGRLVAGGVAAIYERSSTFPPEFNKFAEPRFMLIGFRDR